MAVVLPRALRQFHFAHRAAAADAVHQLALRADADPAVRRVCRGDRAGHPQERKIAKHGRGLLFRRGRAHHRYARKHRPGAKLRPHRDGSFRNEEDGRRGAEGPDPGVVLVGGDHGDHAHGHHADDVVDSRARGLVLSPRSDHRRRNRHVHELRRASDQQARTGRPFRQRDRDGRAADRGILRGARHRAGSARPPRRRGSRPHAGTGGIQGRLIFL